jgi:hypothetical protein
MISHGDPLAELPHFLSFQNLHQLGLPRQDDLYKLFPVGLQVGDQPDLFENRGFQVLRLIDDEDDGTALGILKKKPVKKCKRVELFEVLFGIPNSRFIF